MKRVFDINWKDPKYIRAGIIPYIDINDTRYFALTLQFPNSDLADFGGTIESWDIDALDAAIREYYEESFGIFGEINRENLQDCYVLDGNDTAEILLPVSGYMYDYNQKFYQILGDNIYHEVQTIIWLNAYQILSGIDSKQPLYDYYFRIRDTIVMNRHLLNY